MTLCVSRNGLSRGCVKRENALLSIHVALKWFQNMLLFRGCQIRCSSATKLHRPGGLTPWPHQTASAQHAQQPKPTRRSRVSAHWQQQGRRLSSQLPVMFLLLLLLLLECNMLGQRLRCFKAHQQQRSAW
jgi:hypothetical protein